MAEDLSRQKAAKVAQSIIEKKKALSGMLIRCDEIGQYVFCSPQMDISVFSQANQREILLALLPMDFEGGIINEKTGIPIFISKKGAKKIAHYSALNSRNIAVFSKELCATGTFIGETSCNKANRTDVKRFCYFDARIQINGILYRARLNVIETTNRGYQLYDINKIAPITVVRLGGPGVI